MSAAGSSSSSSSSSPGESYLIETAEDAVVRIRNRDATLASLWFRDDAEFDSHDARLLLAALDEDGSASSIRSVCIGAALQYALFCAMDGADFGAEDVLGELGGGGGGGSRVGSLSLSALLRRMRTLPRLQELLVEGDDRIAQFTSAATLSDVLDAVEPRIRHIRRIHVDSVLNLSCLSLIDVAAVLGGASALCELTLSQLHFTAREEGGDDDELIRSVLGEGDDRALDLYAVSMTLAMLPSLRCLGLGCVVDQPSRSALTRRCVLALCRSRTLHTLKLDSFRLTDGHMQAFYEGLQRPRRRGSMEPAPAALERLYLCRCENRELTERGCRFLLLALEAEASSIRTLFVSPAAVRAAWRSEHFARFTEHVKLMCLLNDVERGLARAEAAERQQQGESQPLKPSQKRDVWLKYLSKCNHDINASFAILVRNPFLFSPPDGPGVATTTTNATTATIAAPAATTSLTATADEAATVTTTAKVMANGDVPTNGGASVNGEAPTNGDAAPPPDGGSAVSTPRRLPKRQRTGSASESPEDEAANSPPSSEGGATSPRGGESV